LEVFSRRTFHTVSKQPNQHNFEILIPEKKSKKTLPLLLTCEHASQDLPGDYNWPLEDKRLVGTHWAIDLGASDLTRELSTLMEVPAILTKYSRLLIDVNRPVDSPTLFRADAEKLPVLLNSKITLDEKNERIRQFHEPYHKKLRELMMSYKPKLVVAIHSFTPMYEGKKKRTRNRNIIQSTSCPC